MKVEKLKNILGETGYPVAYDHFSTENPPVPPYLAFRTAYTNNFFADNIVSKIVAHIELELCTGKKKDPEAEKRLTDILTANKIAWQKTDEGFVESDGLFSVFYEFKEVMDE